MCFNVCLQVSKNGDPMDKIGTRIREVRQSQQRSLADVAVNAGISVATLSRIETDKQALDVELLIVLARVLKTAASDLLASENDGEGEPLARQIATLPARERATFWRDLLAERRAERGRTRGRIEQQLGIEVEELLAQMDFLRDELESIRKRVKKR
jgi:transcriptional regulator with XRE-family HTH domain